MRKTGIKKLIYIFVCSALLLSCDKTKMAANWESEILTFELPEYPDAEIKIDGTLILIHMPEEVADLNMKMEYTMSSGATAIPNRVRSRISVSRWVSA